LGQARGVSGETPIAVLPMYDFPWTARANDALWASISTRLAEAGIPSPKTLTRRPDLVAQWRSPKLIFGQTCGYPYVTALKDVVTLIAAPEYVFPGCDGAAHRSFLVCRARDVRRALGEFRGSTAALNAHDSNTGMNLFRAAIAPIAGGAPFFRAVIVTGSHEASLAAVAQRHADLASIDCVSFALIERGRPELVGRVVVVAESPFSPSLPFIASANLTASANAAVRKALLGALADPDLAEARATLGLAGARAATPNDYDRVAEIEREAAAQGYARLA
jgi:ABC-type phosphate/phosphonate transport system substrate-binding protein